MLFFYPGFAREVNILVVTGGHNFDHELFCELFNSMDGIQWTEAVQPVANQMMVDGTIEKYDVLVFYDMIQEITPEQKQAFLELLNDGKPMLFFHHSLVSYQNWDKFEKIIGGRYYDETRYTGAPDNGFSTYLHDTSITVEIKAKNHPATKGLEDFELFDEVYGNFKVLPTVVPLIGTDHPKSSPVIGWENQYKASKIIYIQPGHGKACWGNENYRKLLSQAIFYLSSKRG